MNELITVEKQNIPQTFEAGGTDALVQMVKDHVKDLVSDTSTLKGRKEIASMAAKVAKSKTYLDGVGKDYVAELKAKPKAVDAERKRMRDTLDELKETVRKPLTEWEEAENKRVMRHEANLEEMKGAGEKARDFWMDVPLQVMVDRFEEIDNQEIGGSWEEYISDAVKTKEASLTMLSEAIGKRQDYEAEQAELEELRQLKAQQERKDRDEALRREGEEKSRRDAEADVAAGIAAKENAERRQKEAEERSVREAEHAVQRERDRIEAEQNAEKEREATRERNTQHRGKVHTAAKEALMKELGITEIQAREIINVIKTGRIPYIEINY